MRLSPNCRPRRNPACNIPPRVLTVIQDRCDECGCDLTDDDRHTVSDETGTFDVCDWCAKLFF